MAETYLNGRYMSCLGCYCWVFFHGVSNPGHKELLLSHGFELWTKEVKANGPGESSYYLDTYDLVSDDSRVPFDHIIDLISGDPLLFALLKQLPVRMGLWWESASGSGGPTFSQKQQRFLWDNKITIQVRATRKSPTDTPPDAGHPSNPYDHECWCGFRAYSGEGAESLKLRQIPQDQPLDGIRWVTHFEDNYGAVFLYGTSAEGHARLCAKHLESFLLSNSGLMELSKSRTDCLDSPKSESHRLDYGWVTCGNLRKIKVAPDFWRSGVELGCDVTFFFFMFVGSDLSDDPQN